MCARITQNITVTTLSEVFSLRADNARELTPPTWNGPPSERYTLCRNGRSGRELTAAIWGLRPRWMRRPSDFQAVNARAETAHEKPSFREAFRSRRCILPVNGWYEWPRGAHRAAPFHISDGAGHCLLLAALWEPPPPGTRGDTFAVLTTEPRPELARIHHRQPSVLEQDEIAAWLDPATPRERVFALARNSGRRGLTIRRVDASANDPRHNTPSLLAYA